MCHGQRAEELSQEAFIYPLGASTGLYIGTVAFTFDKTAATVGLKTKPTLAATRNETGRKSGAERLPTGYGLHRALNSINAQQKSLLEARIMLHTESLADSMSAISTPRFSVKKTVGPTRSILHDPKIEEIDGDRWWTYCKKQPGMLCEPRLYRNVPIV